MYSTSRRLTVLLAAVGAFAVLDTAALPARAADFPDRTVQMIVGFEAGGGADQIARQIAAKLSEEWKQPVVVENKPGATGTIGEDDVAHAKPDGYTIGLVTSSHDGTVGLFKLDYDPVASFTPVVLLATQPDVLIVNAKLPVSSAKDLIAYARAHPGALDASMGAQGLPAYSEMERFEQLAGIKVTNVPFKGSSSAIVSLLGGEVQMEFGGIAAQAAQIKAGKLRALAVADGERSKLLPDVPTLEEATGLKGFEHGGMWYGVLAPAGTAAPRTSAPPRATDCHMHVYDSRFLPLVADPSHATVSDYRLLQKRLGTSRAVIVTPRAYVTDNSATLDAIAQFAGSARGVAVVRPEIGEDGLARLHRGGIRGVRFTVTNPRAAVVSIDMIEPLAQRIAPLGWHLQINMKARQIVEHRDMLERLPVPVVFDHMAGLPLVTGTNDPAYAIVRRLIEQDRAWIKIAFGFALAESSPQARDQVLGIARAYLDHAPERVVWGSDWPHGSSRIKPDDAEMFDLLAAAAPNEKTRRDVLVVNPEKLYGF